MTTKEWCYLREEAKRALEACIKEYGLDADLAYALMCEIFPDWAMYEELGECSDDNWRYYDHDRSCE